MKGILKLSLYSFLFALLVTPLFAKTYSINIAQPMTVGTTQLPAGDYKLSWEGTGPAVKVTLTRSGAAPVIVNAKLVTQKNPVSDSTVVTAAKNGAVVLEQIQLKSGNLVFDESELAQK